MELQEILEDVPKKDAILIIGDWNAKVGDTEALGIVGKYDLGKQNEAGEKLNQFCQENSLVITKTWFQQPKRRLYTWTSPNGRHRNQIDYMLCNRRWKSSITSVKTRPGADCGTDHELLLVNFKIKWKGYNTTSKAIKPNLQNIPYSYNVEVKNRFAELELVNREPEELWQEIHQIIYEEAKRNIPTITTKKKKTWISENTLRIAKERREAKIDGNKQLFSTLNAEFQREVRKDKTQQIQNECKKVEEYNKKGKTRDLFKKIKELRGQFVARNGIILNRNGKQLSDAEEIKKRWEEYTEELYKSDFNTTQDLVDDEYEMEPDILESEVRWAIQSLAKGKAPGQDEIPIELFKELKDDSIKVLTTLC
ncbi:unnamed protein product [Rotaria magnacalcarata]|uniref:Endonuclease/exonuclease/phosphatase domain-containing protein n=1 Tax=Rotaria magnacalcarata TaxID=392030 RepID=A0A815GAL8_9BILA|nr:unnamed protein product [Rotaria magnacalcarata]CAF1342777.1 unnamed protein product [Rotaria magnacalcarata]CAF1923662.1 unnamed protein product [Rotaria magnacalcarata]CAF3857610.1 unnamed protein product [Rotaria magnacalcarata]CAF4113287.1 unnamed protein product [Rotaria magnacalcarata]